MWGRYNMYSSYCDKDSAIIFTTGRLPDVNPPWNWSGCLLSCWSRLSLTCLPKHGRARDNKFLVTHPMIGNYERCLASAIARWAHWPLDHRAHPNTRSATRSLEDIIIITLYISKSFLVVCPYVCIIITIISLSISLSNLSPFRLIFKLHFHKRRVRMRCAVCVTYEPIDSSFI
jgi:hypothetical protein